MFTYRNLYEGLVVDNREYISELTDKYSMIRKGLQIVTDIRRERKKLVNISNYLFM